MKKISLQIPFFDCNTNTLIKISDNEIINSIDKIREKYLKGWDIIKLQPIYKYTRQDQNKIHEERLLSSIEVTLNKKNSLLQTKDITEIPPNLRQRNKLSFKTILSKIELEYWAAKYPWDETKQVYTNVNILNYSNFVGNAVDCEKQIMKIISKKSNSDSDILKVIDLINQWGGKTSRMFYSRNKKNNFISPRDRIHQNLEKYKAGINAAKANNLMAFELFKKVYGISDSFSGKHAMFWSKYNLIVIDNKIAGVLGYKNPSKLFKDYSYEDILNEAKKLAKTLNLENVTIVERALFTFHENYFDNSNTKFNKSIHDFTDLQVAIDVADSLNIKIPNWIKIYLQ